MKIAAWKGDEGSEISPDAIDTFQSGERSSPFTLDISACCKPIGARISPPSFLFAWHSRHNARPYIQFAKFPFQFWRLPSSSAAAFFLLYPFTAGVSGYLHLLAHTTPRWLDFRRDLGSASCPQTCPSFSSDCCPPSSPFPPSLPPHPSNTRRRNLKPLNLPATL